MKDLSMILLGLGANLPLDDGLGPKDTLLAAVEELARRGVEVEAISHWYESQPVPDEGQPWYVNGVVAVRTKLAPKALLDLLMGVEKHFGRIRRKRWESRTLDLDILDYDGLIQQDDPSLILPHPRMHQRRFVMAPLRDVAPDWHHPALGLSADDILKDLPLEPVVRKMAHIKTS